MSRAQRGRVALTVAVLCGALALWWRAKYGEPNVHPSAAAADARADAGAGANADTRASADAGAGVDAGISQTVRDRAVRDAVRGRIARAWSAQPGGARAPVPPPAGADGHAAAAAPEPVPEVPGALDAHYVQSRIREDFVPMAQQCYEDMLTRRPHESARVVMTFRIVGDPRWGGVVDQAFAEGGDGGVPVDAELATCMRESMLSMAFRPPPGEAGAVTVRYPFVFAPGDDPPHAP